MPVVGKQISLPGSDYTVLSSPSRALCPGRGPWGYTKAVTPTVSSGEQLEQEGPVC